METSGKFLPAPVMKMFSDLSTQNFPFAWNIQNDGNAVSLNISWRYQDQRTLAVRSLHSKTPSVIRRDKERMTAFMAGKNIDKSDREVSLAPNGRRPDSVSDVSTFSCSVSRHSKSTSTNSLGTQTSFERHDMPATIASATTQTTRSETKECATFCNIIPEKVNCSVQTNKLQSKNASVQTADNISDATRLSTCTVTRDNYSHKSKVIKTPDDQTMATNSKLNHKRKNTGKHQVKQNKNTSNRKGIHSGQYSYSVRDERGKYRKVVYITSTLSKPWSVGVIYDDGTTGWVPGGVIPVDVFGKLVEAYANSSYCEPRPDTDSDSDSFE